MMVIILEMFSHLTVLEVKYGAETVRLSNSFKATTAIFSRKYESQIEMVELILISL